MGPPSITLSLWDPPIPIHPQVHLVIPRLSIQHHPKRKKMDLPHPKTIRSPQRSSKTIRQRQSHPPSPSPSGQAESSTDSYVDEASESESLQASSSCGSRGRTARGCAASLGREASGKWSWDLVFKGFLGQGLLPQHLDERARTALFSTAQPHLVLIPAATAPRPLKRAVDNPISVASNSL